MKKYALFTVSIIFRCVTKTIILNCWVETYNLLGYYCSKFFWIFCFLIKTHLKPYLYVSIPLPSTCTSWKYNFSQSLFSKLKVSLEICSNLSVKKRRKKCSHVQKQLLFFYHFQPYFLRHTLKVILSFFSLSFLFLQTRNFRNNQITKFPRVIYKKSNNE